MNLFKKAFCVALSIRHFRHVNNEDIAYTVTSTRTALGTEGSYEPGPVESAQQLQRQSNRQLSKRKRRVHYAKYTTELAANPVSNLASINACVYEDGVSALAYNKVYRKVLENQFEIWFDENKGVIKRLFPQRKYYSDVAVAVQFIAHELQHGKGNQKDSEGKRIPGKKLSSVLQDTISLKQAIKKKYKVKDNMNAFAHPYIENFRKQRSRIAKKIKGSLSTSHLKLTDRQHFDVLANVYRPDILDEDGNVVKRAPLRSLRDKYELNALGHTQKGLCWRGSEVLTLDWSDLKFHKVNDEDGERIVNYNEYLECL